MSEIVLVGNSPILLDKELGKQIDSFSHVVRFNNYQIEGFEKYVGTKEDIWCMSGVGHVEQRPYKKRIWIPRNERNKNNLKRFEKLSQVYKSIQYIPKTFCEATDYSVGYKTGWCTTGIYAIAWATETFDEVYVCGFNFFENLPESAIAPHYFKSPLDERIGRVHDLKKERKWYRNMILVEEIQELK